MALIEVRFKLEKETKGALRYQEVDDKGQVIEQSSGQDRDAIIPMDQSAQACFGLPGEGGGEDDNRP
jgi:hypothetical protein